MTVSSTSSEVRYYPRPKYNSTPTTPKWRHLSATNTRTMTECNQRNHSSSNTYIRFTSTISN